MSTTDLVPMPRQVGVVTAADLMPVLDIAQALNRHNFMVEVTKKLMVEGSDYGKIPGTDKPTLLKPGAEKLCTLYGLSPEFAEEHVIEDWNAEEPFFYYRYKCRVMKNGILLGEGIGSCNSRETKYRYRNAQRKCPKCGQAAIFKSKQKPEYYCWTKKEGCGATFKFGDPAIESQELGKVVNPDIADQVNTIQKMAQKRALIAGVLVATNASEFYTQDLDDMQTYDVPQEAPPPASPQRAATAPPVMDAEWTDKPLHPVDAYLRKFRAAKSKFDRLEMFQDIKKRLSLVLGEEKGEAKYYDFLNAAGVQKSDQFKSLGDATRCMEAMITEVLKLEAATRVFTEPFEATDDDLPPVLQTQGSEYPD